MFRCLAKRDRITTFFFIVHWAPVEESRSRLMIVSSLAGAFQLDTVPRLSLMVFEICLHRWVIGVRLCQLSSSCLVQGRLKLCRSVPVGCSASDYRTVILRYVSMPRQLGSDSGIFFHHACGSVPQLTYCCSVVSSLAGAFWLDVVLQTFAE